MIKMGIGFCIAIDLLYNLIRLKFKKKQISSFFSSRCIQKLNVITLSYPVETRHALSLRTVKNIFPGKISHLISGTPYNKLRILFKTLFFVFNLSSRVNHPGNLNLINLIQTGNIPLGVKFYAKRKSFYLIASKFWH